MTVSTSAQTWFMGALFTILIVLYCLPFSSHPFPMAVVLSIVFPVQMMLWRLGYGRKTKDFLFCFSLLLSTLFLKHYWPYSDLVFYAFSILMAAVLRYPVFLGIAGSSIVLEVLREHYYHQEKFEEVAFRYLLFLVAGSLAYLLLREEKKQKEEFKKELDDLKYSIHEMEKAPVAMLSDAGQTSRKVDAALALEDSLKGILRLIYNVFRPTTVILWQYLPDKEQLRLWKFAGDSKDLRENLTFASGEGPVGWAALNKKPFLQQDRAEGVSFSIRNKGLPVLSLLAVPVLEGDRLEGVLSLDSPHQHFFAADAATAMESFAAQISEAIRMARVARDREEMAFEFQAFYHASKELSSLIQFDDIVKKLRRLCAEIVPSQYTAITIMEGEGTTYSVYEWEPEDEVPQSRSGLMNDGHTWISWFMSNREEPLIVSQGQLQLQDMPTLYPDEAFEGFVTYLAVPMRHQQRCIGALLLAGDHKDAFSAHQARILLILCNQAAVSLENSSIIQKMEELAITDGLTGLYNHRYFQDAIQTEIERAERLHQPLSLLLMDIDHFKNFNDSFGHPAGDFVLRNLGVLLRSNARKIDILSRYGGEEFAALLPGVDGKSARKTAERWRKSVQRASLKMNEKSFAITLSIGYASYPQDAAEKTELIEKADQALYFAKESGRNQVRHSTDTDQKRFTLFGS